MWRSEDTFNSGLPVVKTGSPLFRRLLLTPAQLALKLWTNSPVFTFFLTIGEGVGLGLQMASRRGEIELMLSSLYRQRAGHNLCLLFKFLASHMTCECTLLKNAARGPAALGAQATGFHSSPPGQRCSVAGPRLQDPAWEGCPSPNKRQLRGGLLQSTLCLSAQQRPRLLRSLEEVPPLGAAERERA